MRISVAFLFPCHSCPTLGAFLFKAGLTALVLHRLPAVRANTVSTRACAKTPSLATASTAAYHARSLALGRLARSFFLFHCVLLSWLVEMLLRIQMNPPIKRDQVPGGRPARSLDPSQHRGVNPVVTTVQGSLLLFSKLLTIRSIFFCMNSIAASA